MVQAWEACRSSPVLAAGLTEWRVAGTALWEGGPGWEALFGLESKLSDRLESLKRFMGWWPGAEVCVGVAS